MKTKLNLYKIIYTVIVYFLYILQLFLSLLFINLASAFFVAHLIANIRGNDYINRALQNTYNKKGTETA